jgi:hypothetical protein
MGSRPANRHFHYIDIFDDGLYSQGTFAKDERSIEALGLIRLQALWALLFDGYLIVPEQWAVSSLAFFRVGGEIAKSYGRYLERIGSDVVALATALREPPIRIGILPDASTYPEAMRRRLMDPEGPFYGIGALNHLTSDEAGGNRATLALLLRDELRKPSADRFGSRAFDQLEEILKDSSLAAEIVALLHYADRVERAHTKMALYAPALERHFAVIRETLATDSVLSTIYADEARLFEDFFRRIEADGISLGDIHGLRKTVALYGAADGDRLLHAGRICVHNALTEISGSNVGSVTYERFHPPSVRDFDRELVRQIKQGSLDNLGGSEKDVGDFEQLYRFGSSYDVDTFLSWSAIWDAVWPLRYSDAWLEKRERLFQRIAKLDLHTRWTAEAWDEIFDWITSQLVSVVVSRDPNEPGSLRIGLPSRVATGIENIGAAGMATSIFLTGSSLSFPVGALGALLFLSGLLAKGKEVVPTALDARRIWRFAKSFAKRI